MSDYEDQPEAVNLYAVVPSYAPHVGRNITFILAATDEEAMAEGVRAAASDLIMADNRARAVYRDDGSLEPAWRMQYGSPSAEVYLVAENVGHVGTAQASDAPGSWQWAHPAVEEGLARLAFEEATGFASGPDELPGPS